MATIVDFRCSSQKSDSWCAQRKARPVDWFVSVLNNFPNAVCWRQEEKLAVDVLLDQLVLEKFHEGARVLVECDASELVPLRI